MPFVTAGFPSMQATEDVIPVLESAGASIVEVGFPFSDPIADGPVIAQSMARALAAGVTPRDIFAAVRRIRSLTNIGLLAMVSDSIITRIGPERFVCDAAEAGFDGLIVPDVDLEAARPLSGLARLHKLSFTLLIAPTTSAERIRQIASLCSGFIYVLARAGITGERDQLDIAALGERIALIRRCTDLPLAVGFGVSRPEHVAAIRQVADAAIVGSALVRTMDQSSAAAAVEAAGRFVQSLSGGK